MLAVAVVVGALLLWSWGDDGSTTVQAGNGDTTTTIDTSELGTTTTGAEAITTTTTGGTEHTPSEVSVLVLNGSGQTGVAGTTSTRIGEAGYVMGTAGNAPANVETTSVYYADGYESDAIAIAQILGKGTDAVKPLTEASLGGAEGDSDVVVVLGADTPPASEGTTTSTTTG